MSRVRRAACRLLRAWALRQLAAATARGFALPQPALRGPGYGRRLAQYAAFAREAALGSLRRGGEVEASLYAQALALGRRARRLLGVRTPREALAACRLLYEQIGIDLLADEQGQVVVRRCYFSRVYEPAVCRVISALDRGLVSGLTGGGQLSFGARITEGAAACLGRIEALSCAREEVS